MNLLFKNNAADGGGGSHGPFYVCGGMKNILQTLIGFFGGVLWYDGVSWYVEAKSEYLLGTLELATFDQKQIIFAVTFSSNQSMPGDFPVPWAALVLPYHVGASSDP